MKRLFAAIFISLIVFSPFSAINPSVVKAWGQGPNYEVHEAINVKAVEKFLDYYSSSPKYVNSFIDRNKKHKGPVVTSHDKSAHEVEIDSMSFVEWVEHGGYSADEPHLWACFKHFYDPLAVSGRHELTDHSALFRFRYSAISAKDWAFDHYNNPFSWYRALEYYKKAMEIGDDDKIKVVPGSGLGHDNRDPDIPVSSPAEARSVYLAKAFRALGESMHMLADMTQPAHVRNDSHPNVLGYFDPDPLEEAVTVNSGIVSRTINKPVVSSVGTSIDSAENFDKLWGTVAGWVNSNFYTEDTIYDKATGIKPNNWETPYPRPQFSELVELGNKSGVSRPRPVSYIGNPKYFDGAASDVYMIQETFSSYLMRTRWGAPSGYTIPTEFCASQAAVLLPIAVKANARLIDFFFPTMELKINVEQGEDVRGAYGKNYPSFKVTSQMEHLIDKDVEWQLRVSKIEYSGPAELWRQRNGKDTKIADLNFRWGEMWNSKAFSDYIRIELGDEKSTFTYGDTVFILIKAGGRTFKSNEYIFPGDYSLNILPPPDILAGGGAIDTRYIFVAAGTNIPENATYTWTISFGGKDYPQPQTTGSTISGSFKSPGRHTLNCTASWTETTSDGKTVPRSAVASPLTFDITSLVSLTLSPSNLQGEPGKSYTFKATATSVPTGAKYRWIVDGKTLDADTTEYTLRWHDAGTKSVRVDLVHDDKVIATANAQAIIKAAQPPPAQPTKPPPAPQPNPCGWTTLGTFTGNTPIKVGASGYPVNPTIVKKGQDIPHIGEHQVKVPGPGQLRITLTVWGPKHYNSNTNYGSCRFLCYVAVSSSQSAGVNGRVSGCEYFSGVRDRDSCSNSWTVKDAGNVSLRVFPEGSPWCNYTDKYGPRYCCYDSLWEVGYVALPHSYDVKVEYNPCK